MANIINGTSGNDSLSGTAGADIINGLGGNDTILGGAGDTVYGGDGADSITGSVLDGGAGADTMVGLNNGKGSVFYVEDEGDVVLATKAELGYVNELYVWDFFQSSGIKIPNNINVVHVVESVDFGAEGISGAADVIYLSDQSNAVLWAGHGLNSDWGKLYAGDGGDTIQVGGAAEVFGENGDDQLVLGNLGGVAHGGLGNDTISSGLKAAGTAFLYGDEGNDKLYGRYGNDVLDGGAGSDSMFGGVGADLYLVDEVGDVVTDVAPVQGASSSDVDTVRASVSFDLSKAAYVEVLELTGGADINGLGSDLDNQITGNTGVNLLTGANGNDTLIAVGGNDSLSGGDGNDLLVGSNGTDTLDGGANDDTYRVATAGTSVVEAIGGGVDTEIFVAGFQSAQGATLANNVENGTIELAGNVDLTGNGYGNKLTGNADANKLSGLAGMDTLDGGAGNDTLVGGLGADVLTGGLGDDRYVFYKGDGVDVVNDAGGTGASRDVLAFADAKSTEVAVALSVTGDVVFTNTVGDQITVQHAFGADASGLIESIEFADGVTWSAAQLFKQAKLTGTAGNDTLVGSPNLAMSIDGGAGNDVITGGALADTLDGGQGADTLTGGAGNDTYFIDDAGDRVIEAADGGTRDVERGTISYTVADNVERGVLLGSANLNLTGRATAGTALNGNAGNNVITGGADHDVLYGGAGKDTLVGGAGSDIYQLDDAYDVVVELEQDDGVDAILSLLSHTDMPDNVEILQLAEAYADSATGNKQDNTIFGNSDGNQIEGLAGNDDLWGRDGDDTLVGGAGNDTMVGGAGNDVYVQNAGDGVDTINDADTSGGQDALVFSTTASNKLWFSHVGDSLQINTLGSADQVTIQHWYAGNSNKVETIMAFGKTVTADRVEGLVQAMAGIAPPAGGVGTLTTAQQTAVNAAMAQAWA